VSYPPAEVEIAAIEVGSCPGVGLGLPVEELDHPGLDFAARIAFQDCREGLRMNLPIAGPDDVELGAGRS
jgi:hypothetical protein